MEIVGHIIELNTHDLFKKQFLVTGYSHPFEYNALR